MSAFRAFEAISALAGAGKTYQLTSRYIALLAMGVEPSRILAITFTRKAAAEIFDRIIRRLAAASLEAVELGRLRDALAQQLGAEHPAVAGLTAAQVQAWLARLLSDMSHVRISTIDSLFALIVRSYALELGLPARQELLEGIALEQAREEALGSAFDAVGRDAASRRMFVEAFKQVTGEESREVREELLEAVDAGHQLFMDISDEAAWGDPGRMLDAAPLPPWWAPVAGIDTGRLLATVAALRQRLHARPELTIPMRKGLAKWLDCVGAFDWDGALESTIGGHLLAVRDDLAHGHAEIAYYKRAMPWDGADAADAWYLLASCAAAAIGRRLTAARGLYRLLAAYEEACQSTLRSRGRLSFSDIPILLNRMCRENVRLDIDYRLDGRIDHWLIDEFQDTNADQWRVIRGLAAELLQSGGAQRSFFYVGDVKQAIYAWRGGRSTLFEAVRKRYADAFGNPTILQTSWRSSRVVLNVVNRVFGKSLAVTKMADRYENAAQAWREHWAAHEPAPVNESLPGRVELHEVKKPESRETSVPGKIALTCGIVADLLNQGARSIAVLVRLNSYGDRIADALRTNGIPVRRETAPRLRDNGVVSVFLSLLQLADHPGDQLAGPHVRMSPLWEVLSNWIQGPDGNPDDLGSDAVSTRVQRVAARLGVSGLLGEIIDRCRKASLLDDAFIHLRIRQLLDAAADFDRQGGGTPSAFAQLAAGLQVSDPSVDGRVVVMTVHKAKGLEFDAVLLPDLEGSRREMDAVRSGSLQVGGEVDADVLVSGESGDAEASHRQWVLPLPIESVCNADPTLEQFAAEVKERRVEEELCLLYVAMTRARQGLYLITEEPPTDGRSLYPAGVVRETLVKDMPEPAVHYPGVESRRLFEEGEVDWPARRVKGDGQEKTSHDASIQLQPFAWPRIESRPDLRRLMYRTPTHTGSGRSALSMSDLISASSAATDRGLLIHDLLGRIEWFAPGCLEAAVEQLRVSGTVCPDAVYQEVAAALKAPEIQAALQRPAGSYEVWREQAFEFAEGSVWMSGRMDRVVVHRDDAGRPVSAVVMDFKSDRVSGEEGLSTAVARHASQLETYCRAVAALLGLDPAAVQGRLVFLAAGRVLGVNAAA